MEEARSKSTSAHKILTNATTDSQTKNIKKKKMHAMIGNNLWEIGREEFKKKDVLAVWVEALWRRKRKWLVRNCILHGITEDKVLGAVEFHEDLEYMPSWQSYVRDNVNNLNLQRIDCN